MLPETNQIRLLSNELEKDKSNSICTVHMRLSNELCHIELNKWFSILLVASIKTIVSIWICTEIRQKHSPCLMGPNLTFT